MTDEEVERAIEFLLNHHAQVSADIQELKEAQKITTATVASLARQADADRREMRETIEGLVEEMRDRYNSAIDEMRDGFNKLILANEVTRDLISQVARLQIGTNQRVTAIEEKLAT
jgi:predicted DNA-binding protein